MSLEDKTYPYAFCRQGIKDDEQILRCRFLNHEPPNSPHEEFEEVEVKKRLFVEGCNIITNNWGEMEIRPFGSRQITATKDLSGDVFIKSEW